MVIDWHTEKVGMHKKNKKKMECVMDTTEPILGNIQSTSEL